MNILTKILRVLAIAEYRRAALRTRVAAATEHDALLQPLALDTVVDIGANRGQFALCIRRLFPNAAIYSFEPLRRPADTYAKVFAGDPRTRLLRKAVADQSGPSAMHVSRWDVSSSLLPIGAAQQANFPFTQQAGTETVEVARLANCLPATALEGTALLKLDVQGSELATLRGCEEMLREFEYVYVEASFVELYVGQALAGEVVGYLYERGFILACVTNLSHGKSASPIQADFLFRRVGDPARNARPPGPF